MVLVIVLDTNCLIQSIPRQSRYRVVWDSLVRGEHVLCVSTEILEEYVEILQRLTDYDTAELIVKTIVNSPFVELITPYYHFEMIKDDPDDNKQGLCLPGPPDAGFALPRAGGGARAVRGFSHATVGTGAGRPLLRALPQFLLCTIADDLLRAGERLAAVEAVVCCPGGSRRRDGGGEGC